MRSHCSTTTELDRSALDGACEDQLPRRDYFDRISRTIEHGILAFVVLLALLGNYAIHIQLMRDVLLS